MLGERERRGESELSVCVCVCVCVFVCVGVCVSLSACVYEYREHMWHSRAVHVRDKACFSCVDSQLLYGLHNSIFSLFQTMFFQVGFSCFSSFSF